MEVNNLNKSLVEKINDQFNLKLQEFEDNDFYLKNINEFFHLGFPSEKLETSEFPLIPIVLTQAALRKALGLKKDKADEAHNLTVNDFKDFVLKVHNPIIVIKGSTDNSRLALIELKKTQNRTTVVPVHLSVKFDEIIVNNIPTIYTKNQDSLITLIDTAIAKNMVFYCDVDKIKNWLKYSRKLQLLPTLLSQFDSTKIKNSDTESQEKNKKSLLGAIEILSQNGKVLDFKGFKPTYKILSDYSHLITKSDNKYTLTGNGLKDTLAEIRKVAINHKSEVAKLAIHLYSGNKEQDAFNVWHWIITNLKYNFDKPGKEEIRTPARSFVDGTNGIGIDCEDMAIFAVCLLANMNYAQKFNVVNFNNKPDPGHIYAMLTDVKDGIYYANVPGIVCDAVMTKFNTHPDFITKNFIMEGIPVYTLSGTEESNILVSGIDGICRKPDAVTSHLMAKRFILRKKGVNGLGRTSNDAELRKAETLIMLNGTEERDIILGAMPFIEDISPSMNYVFENEAVGKLVENYFNEIDEELQGIDGLGEIAAKAKKQNIISKAKEKLQKAVKVVKETTKKAAEKVKETVKKAANTKVVKAIIKYNPASIAARNGLRIILALNIGNYAYKLAPAYLTEAEANAKGYDLTELKKVKETLLKLVNLFTAAGGKKENLKKDILSGAAKKQKKIDKKDLKGLEGLGVVVATSVAAATTASTPFWTKIIAWFKNIDFKKLFGKVFKKKQEIDEASSDEGTNPNTVDLGPESSAEVFDINKENEKEIEEAKNSYPDSSSSNDTQENKNSWILPVGIAAAALAIFAFTR